MAKTISQPSSSSSNSPAEKQQAWQDFILAWSKKDTNDFQRLFVAPIDLDTVSGKNCENVVGGVVLPVGVAGPVTILDDQKKEFLVPLATTEGALVASVARGCKALNQAGGVQVQIEKIGMTRAPVFLCSDGRAAIKFKSWISGNFDLWKELTESTSNHLQLKSVNSWVRGRQVFARFVFDTDEAMGMNMVSIALQSAWEKLSATQPLVQMVALSSNICSDKKESQINRLFGRGYWVQAEAVISHQILKDVLKTTPEKLFQTHYSKNLVGSSLAGSFSQNMQVANVVAAVYAATGQDLAHVVEGSQATTTIEITEAGIYAAVTLPNVNIGTVGGGTMLATQSQARNMISSQPVTSLMVAQVVGAASLAAELSGLAALSTQSLAQAHQRLGRGAQGDQKS